MSPYPHTLRIPPKLSFLNTTGYLILFYIYNKHHQNIP